MPEVIAAAVDGVGSLTEVDHVLLGQFGVVGEVLHAVETEEELGAVGQLQGHPLCRLEREVPQIADPAGDPDGPLADVTRLRGHTCASDSER